VSIRSRTLVGQSFARWRWLTASECPSCLENRDLKRLGAPNERRQKMMQTHHVMMFPRMLPL
jgi:hypothetical protein